MIRFFALALAISLTACDGGGGPDGEEPPTTADCSSVGLQDLGTVSATTPNGSIRTSCAAVSSAGRDLAIIVRTPGDASSVGDDAFTFGLPDLQPGVYILGGGADVNFGVASYGRTPLATSGAVSGTFTVTSISGGVEGRFEFTTATGTRITDGRLDLTF